VSQLHERTVEVSGVACRIWEYGSGPRVGYLAGIAGLPRWSAFTEMLAESFTVVVPSIPGFPGSDGHGGLTGTLDWLLAVRDLLAAAGLEQHPLIASSVAGALAVDVAAVWPELISRLVLIAPFGWFDEAEPSVDIWAVRAGAGELARLVCVDPDRFMQLCACPADANPLEWELMLGRALEASARYSYPLGDTGVMARLARIRRPVLFVHGEEDRVLPVSYSRRMAAMIGAHARVLTVSKAGHAAEIDRPRTIARLVAADLGYLDER
jgi:pimeloyl-ACP methyl ester carboxylesterase